MTVHDDADDHRKNFSSLSSFSNHIGTTLFVYLFSIMHIRIDQLYLSLPAHQAHEVVVLG